MGMAVCVRVDLMHLEALSLERRRPEGAQAGGPRDQYSGKVVVPMGAAVMLARGGHRFLSC